MIIASATFYGILPKAAAFVGLVDVANFIVGLQATAWGLRTLDERMRALGGGLALENVRGGGARLRLVVPLQPARAPAQATLAPTAPTP